MARRRTSHVADPIAQVEIAQPRATRRRAPLSPSSTNNGYVRGIKEINVTPMLEHYEPGLDTKSTMTVSRAIAMVGVMGNSALPAFLSWGLTMSLIFGGCCSNVFALEAIVKEEPESGLLITLVQFIITALFAWPAHFSISRPPFFLKKPAVPLLRWLPNVLLFFTVNMLNNFAFGYNISVPVHIILRSGGSVTTLLVGWIWGKRYTKGQVLGVTMLTLGVIVAAMADAHSKGKASPASHSSITSFMTGLTILFLAQVLSAIMGLYTQATYAKHGPHWNENLFYSHFLSLPLFIPLASSLRAQFIRLISSRSLVFVMPAILDPFPKSTFSTFFSHYFPAVSTFAITPKKSTIAVPTHLVTLLLNSLTQYACIRGVNLLGARTSALGVTIVLNVRKLVSLFASIWLFGNEVPFGVLGGAAVVFAGAAVYSLGEGQGIRSAKAKARNM